MTRLYKLNVSIESSLQLDNDCQNTPMIYVHMNLLSHWVQNNWFLGKTTKCFCFLKLHYNQDIWWWPPLLELLLSFQGRNPERKSQLSMRQERLLSISSIMKEPISRKHAIVFSQLAWLDLQQITASEKCYVYTHSKLDIAPQCPT